MKEKTRREIALLSDTIDIIEQDMKAGNILFLQEFENTMKRARSTLQDSEMVSGTLIDVAKHLGNLKYKVWEKMLSIVQYTPVTLDPNTAHPTLDLSEELTCVQARKRRRLPASPERFDRCACVLGTEGFTSGRHIWDVDVGDNADWTLGVAKESAKRTGKLSLSTAEGFLAIQLKGEELLALTSPARPLPVSVRPQKIRVKLDWQSDVDGRYGRVTFSDLSNGACIHTFEHRHKEKLFPIFSPGRHPGRLQILPGMVSVKVEEQESFFQKYRDLLLPILLIAFAAIIGLTVKRD
ncbi:hypothetical protein MATL_G00001690 [Megalops atlanticus]|uniref:B30.2/SPRY domain-containing protein n=1 Tax=Megalops atlanticus TaxID=7932 RepID=A0A9D3QGL1_MEGAT|nr:hypothetical protein MATL_G00001690 [Megalops atlanticus]